MGYFECPRCSYRVVAATSGVSCPECGFPMRNLLVDALARD